MVGKKGIVEKPLYPSGFARVHGEVWLAGPTEGVSPLIQVRPSVRIEEIRGLTLIVHRDRGGVEIEPHGSRRVERDQSEHG